MNCVHCGDRKAMVCTQCEEESLGRWMKRAEVSAEVSEEEIERLKARCSALIECGCLCGENDVCREKESCPINENWKAQTGEEE